MISNYRENLEVKNGMTETENCLLKALTFFLIQTGKLPVNPHKKASVSNITQNGQS